MLGEQIRKLRQARKISQTELAKDLNVTKQSVSNWENDNIMPSIDMLKRMCEYFGCTSDYLLEIKHDDNIFTIETTGLSLAEIAHIQQIIRDLQYLEAFKRMQENK